MFTSHLIDSMSCLSGWLLHVGSNLAKECLPALLPDVSDRSQVDILVARGMSAAQHSGQQATDGGPSCRRIRHLSTSAAEHAQRARQQQRHRACGQTALKSGRFP
jgi:hypothetical protein